MYLIEHEKEGLDILVDNEWNPVDSHPYAGGEDFGFSDHLLDEYGLEIHEQLGVNDIPKDIKAMCNNPVVFELRRKCT